jgi:hypothetical protein
MTFINAHEVILDQRERLEAWITFNRAVCLVTDFVKIGIV